MKRLFFLLLFSGHLLASVEEFPVRGTGEKLPKKTFDRIITLFESTFSPVAGSAGRQFEIMTDYQSEWAQAFARRWETDQIIVYGGIAALKNGSEDSFSLILCHEAGHLYGGPPVSDEHNRLSLEGQADYWAITNCFRKILPHLSVRKPSLQSVEYCNEDLSCARAVDAIHVVTAHFADNRNLPHPRRETPDETEVASTNLTHPSPQCRLDTMIAGMEGRPRPLCWYKPNSPEVP